MTALKARGLIWRQALQTALIRCWGSILASHEHQLGVLTLSEQEAQLPL